VSALTELLAPRGLRVVAPDLNIPSFERLDFRAMVKISIWEMKKRMPAAIVGSSLGALVALEAAQAVPAAPLVLIAPALGFGQRWLKDLPPDEFLPFFHHGEEKEIPIHRRFFEEMSRVEADREPPRVAVTILMGRKDESVPFDLVGGVWKRWQESSLLDPRSRFIEIPEGDHGLTDHVARIAEEIQRSCDLPRKPPAAARLG
jgi:pimeloyl-ACP methyl ester carboxylesterase